MTENHKQFIPLIIQGFGTNSNSKLRFQLIFFKILNFINYLQTKLSSEKSSLYLSSDSDSKEKYHGSKFRTVIEFIDSYLSHLFENRLLFEIEEQNQLTNEVKKLL